MWSWDPVMDSIWYSSEVYRVHGVASGGLGSGLEDYLAFVHPDDRARIREAAGVAATGETLTVQYRFVHPEAGIRRLSASSALVCDGLGNPQRLVGTVQDITEVAQARRNVSEAFARLSAYFEETPTPAYLWRKEDDAFVLRHFNKAARARWGQRAAELIGRSASVVCADRPDMISDIRTCLESQAPIVRETDFKTDQMGTRRLVITYVPVGPDSVVAHADDISDELEARRGAEEATARLAEYFHRIPTPAYLWRLVDGQIVLEASNRAGVEDTRGRVTDVIGTTAAELYASRPDIVRDLTRAVGGETFTREMKYFRSTNEEQDLVVTYVHIPPHGAAAHTKDVTEQRRVEGALAESRDALRSLLRHLEHVREQERVQVARDLHDELGSVLTALKIELVEAGSSGRRGAEVEALEGMVRLVDQAIEVGRRVTVRLRPGILDDLGLAAAAEWLVSDFEKRTGIRCRLSLPEGCLELSEPVATAMFRILQEALTNVARHADAERVTATLEVDADRVGLTVSDDGAGFDPEEPGTGGFGLLGIRERVGAFAGVFDIVSGGGRGTSIHVELPRIVDVTGTSAKGAVAE